MKPEPQTIYPTMDSINEVIELASSKVPVTKRNEMYALLMTFQNTLLKLMKESNASK
jgi:hypothetical protein